MLWAIEPLLILFLAGWFLREQIAPSLVVLSLIAVGGMLLADLRAGGCGVARSESSLTLAGVACCAAYTVIARRWLPSADSTTQVVASQQIHALAFATALVALAWLMGGAVRPMT